MMLLGKRVADRLSVSLLDHGAFAMKLGSAPSAKSATLRIDPGLRDREREEETADRNISGHKEFGKDAHGDGTSLV